MAGGAGIRTKDSLKGLTSTAVPQRFVSCSSHRQRPSHISRRRDEPEVQNGERTHDTSQVFEIIFLLTAVLLVEKNKNDKIKNF